MIEVLSHASLSVSYPTIQMLTKTLATGAITAAMLRHVRYPSVDLNICSIVTMKCQTEPGVFVLKLKIISCVNTKFQHR